MVGSADWLCPGFNNQALNVAWRLQVKFNTSPFALSTATFTTFKRLQIIDRYYIGNC